jgi:hypothetical protein
LVARGSRSVTRKSAGPGVGTAHMAHLWVVGVLLLFYHVTPLDLAPKRRPVARTGHLDDCTDRCAHDQAIAIGAAHAEERDWGRLLHGCRLGRSPDACESACADRQSWHAAVLVISAFLAAVYPATSGVMAPTGPGVRRRPRSARSATPRMRNCSMIALGVTEAARPLLSARRCRTRPCLRGPGRRCGRR